MIWFIVAIILSIIIFIWLRKFEDVKTITSNIFSLIISFMIGIFLSKVLWAIIFSLTWGICGSTIDIKPTDNPMVSLISVSINIEDNLFSEYIIIDKTIETELQITQ